MLKDANNIELYQSHYSATQSTGTQQAYFYLIGWASTLKDYMCYPTEGKVKDFRLYRDNNYDFAFIPNQKWLLFYFRKPCLCKYSKNSIINYFPDANENKRGELTVKVSSLESAIKLAAYIGI